jgi:hypothetical protein
VSREHDEIDQLIASAVRPLVNGWRGRELAAYHFGQYLQTLPPGDVATMKPDHFTQLAHDYIRDHGPQLKIPMKDQTASRKDLADRAYKALASSFYF